MNPLSIKGCFESGANNLERVKMINSRGKEDRESKSTNDQEVAKMFSRKAGKASKDN